MSNRGFLLNISSNTTTGGLFFEKAIRMGFRVVLVSKDRSRYPFLTNMAVDVVEIDETDWHAVSSFALNFARTHHVAGVMSTSDFFQPAAADLARKLGLPAGDAKALRFCRSKANQRRRLAEAGLAQPQFHVALTVQQAAIAFSKISGPVVIKPIDGSGSVGVRLASTAGEVREVAEHLLSRTTNERGLPVEPSILVEEYIEGDEFSIEIFDGCVIGVTKKYLGAKPFFVEIGHTFPAPIADSDRHSLETTAISACQSLRLLNGPVHVEARIANEKAIIIEVNSRLAGGCIPQLIELTGTDLICKTIALSTGANPLTPITKFPAAAVRFVLAPASGPIFVTYGMETARAMPGVQQVNMYRLPGDSVNLFGDFRDRIGHVVAVGVTPRTATENAINATRTISVAVATMQEVRLS